jgi:hypothetical protein
MRKLRDLDEEIARVERRLEAGRDALSDRLYDARLCARRTVSAPGALVGALAFGFIIDRLGRLRRRGAQRAQRASMAGLVAGLAAAALRGAIANPRLWQALQARWRGRAQPSHTRSF